MFAQATFARVEQLHHALATTLAVTLEQTPEFRLEPALRPEHRLFPEALELAVERTVAVRRATQGFAFAL